MIPADHVRGWGPQRTVAGKVYRTGDPHRGFVRMVSDMDPEVPFSIVDDDAPVAADGFVVVVDGSTRGSGELLEELGRALGFPNWYGVNWNALLDCLCDLTWVAEPRVTIWHESLPRGLDDALHHYVGVLATAVREWRRDPRHDLAVVWRERDRRTVLEALARDALR